MNRRFTRVVGYLFALLFIVMSGVSRAEGATETINVQAPAIDWSGVAASLISSLTSVAVVGLGIGISIWVLFLISRIFKRSAS